MVMINSSNIREDDFKNIVTIETDKNQLIVEKRGPHSFWYISIKKGNLPESYKGAYTSKENAIKDATKWIESKSQSVKTIED